MNHDIQVQLREATLTMNMNADHYRYYMIARDYGILQRNENSTNAVEIILDTETVETVLLKSFARISGINSDTGKTSCNDYRK